MRFGVEDVGIPGDWGFKGALDPFALRFASKCLGGVSLYAYISYANGF